MSFWLAAKASHSNKPQNKPSFVKTSELLKLVKSDESFSTSSWSRIRFFGPAFGIKTIPVPIIKEERFYRKENAKFLVALPKQSLGYDYRTRTSDDSKCPYLKYINLDNPLLATAVINYVYDQELPNAEAIVRSIENDGLRKTYFNPNLKKDLQSRKELMDVLRPISMKGTEKFYTNVLMYNDSYVKLPEESKKRFIDLSLRSESEKIKVSLLNYEQSFGEKLYLCDSIDSERLTPIQVLELSEANVEDIRNNVALLNTTYDEESQVEIQHSIEDPKNGCGILVQLEARQIGKTTIHTKKFMKDQQRPLTENEKKFMLWNLEILKTKETFDEAYDYVEKIGYTSNSGWENSSKTVRVDFSDSKKISNSKEDSSRAESPSSRVSKSEPKEVLVQQTDFPWGDDSSTPKPVKSAVKEVKSTSSAVDEENLFDD